MNNKFLLPLSLILLLASACNIINPEEEIPTWLMVSSVTLDADCDSHKITDVYVYVNDRELGAFPLPAMIPVLGEGTFKVDIFAGIKSNGIAASPDIYPFYERYQTEIDFIAGETVTLEPVFTYLDNLTIPIQEDFEGINHVLSFDRDGNSNTEFEISSTNSFEGTSGRAVLTATDFYLETASNAISVFPTNGSYASYIEMNYKTDIPLALGLIGYDINGIEVYSDFSPLINLARGVNPREEWNKVYFEMDDSMQALTITPGVVSYEVVFTTIFDEADQQTMSEAVVQIDNFKLIYF